LLKVKPTEEMPRPGKHRSKPTLTQVDAEIGAIRKRTKKK
jgi:hypothetical protein